MKREKHDPQLHDFEMIISVENVLEILRRKFKAEKRLLLFNNDMHEKEIGVIFVAGFYVRKMGPEEELQHGPFIRQLQ